MVEPTVGEGSWFAYVVPRPAAVTSWLLPRKDSKKVARLLSAVSASWDDDLPIVDAAGGSYSEGLAASGPSGGAGLTPYGTSAGSPAVGLSRQPSVTNAQSYVFASAGLTVKQGLNEVADSIYRVTPFVHCAPDNSAVVAFTGHLLNLQELAHRYRSPATTPKRPGGDSNNHHHAAPASPSAAAAAAAMAGGSLARQGSIERSLDVGGLTASTVLAMYHHDDNECVLLSELQGQYAFIILDNSRRIAFAARDPSGSETLFYRIGDDGSASFASSRAAIPDDAAADAGGGEWLELPPGHYISGKTPKLHQFALTPEQLQVREMCEDLGPRFAMAKRRSSLDNNARTGRDGDLFGMEL